MTNDNYNDRSEYSKITWPDVREGDVLFHENGDRLTVSAVDFDGYQTCKSTAGSWHSVSTLRGSGFFPYRKQPELPTTPGAYIDKDGDYWLLDRSGNWYDWSRLDEPDVWGGNPQKYAPFTRLVPMPTREQIRAEG